LNYKNNNQKLSKGGILIFVDGIGSKFQVSGSKFQVACQSKAIHPITSNFEVASRSAGNLELETWNLELGTLNSSVNTSILKSNFAEICFP
jgi:hypothetical protein